MGMSQKSCLHAVRVGLPKEALEVNHTPCRYDINVICCSSFTLMLYHRVYKVTSSPILKTSEEHVPCDRFYLGTLKQRKCWGKDAGYLYMN